MSMPTMTQQDTFIDALSRSALVEGETLAAFLAQHESQGTLPDDTTRLAALFVRDGLLTRFQAKLLLQGRPRRFFIGGKFKMLEQLGQGGMGAVYLCEHLLMRRLVAVKVLPTQRLHDPSTLERFFREARAVAALDHPNLVRAYDADRDGDVHFLVMEFVDGTSLQQLVHAHGPLDIARACNCIAQAAAGLQHAHEAGWVHRDIKPGNILLDRGGNVKLLDLGLARLFADETDNLTRKFDDKATLGTADYLPPEQALDISQVDIRGDIYSLGATFYYVLSGRAPFGDRVTTAQKLVAHQMVEPTPLRELRPGVPPQLAAIVQRMMAKTPADRPQIPLDVVRALEPWTAAPLPPPSPEQMPKWSKAITELLNQSDPRMMRSTASAAVTVSNRGQVTRPIQPPALPTPSSGGRLRAPENLSNSGTRSSQSSGPRSSATRQRSGKASRKGPGKQKNIPPAVAAAVIAAVVLLCGGLIAWFAWPQREPETTDTTRIAGGQTSRGEAGQSTRSGSQPAQSNQQSSSGSASPSKQVANLGTTIYVAADRSRAPAGAQRVQASLRAALAEAKPGETVVVTDDVFKEVLLLDDGLLGRRVTLSGERPDGKRVLWQPPTGHRKAPFIQISNLQGFTLRGFQIDGNDDEVDSLIAVSGSCAGLRLEDLHLTQFKKVGVELRAAEGETDEPITLRRLRIESGKKNQRRAAILAQANSRETRHLLIDDCRFEGFFESIVRIEGSLSYGIVRNSRFLIFPQSVKSADRPHLPSDAVFVEGARNLRLTVANNTFLRFQNGIRLAALPARRAENRVVFRNNLILNMQAAVQIGNEGDSIDEAAVAELFQNFEGNLCRPNNCSKGVQFLVPTARSDIDRLSDSTADDATFLRYEPTSKLMTAGAGNEPVGAPPQR